jgi:hypothetical protein
MSPEVSSKAPRHRGRPWYLVAALVLASIFGLSSAIRGWNHVSMFHQSRPDPGWLVRDVTDQEERARLETAMQGILDAYEQAKGRLYPLSVAEMLIGIALFVMAGRAMRGRPFGRNAVRQLIAVQGALAIATYCLTPEVRGAYGDNAAALASPKLRELAQEQAKAHEPPQGATESKEPKLEPTHEPTPEQAQEPHGADEPASDPHLAEQVSQFFALLLKGKLLLETLANMAIFLALSTRRTRDYFENGAFELDEK